MYSLNFNYIKNITILNINNNLFSLYKNKEKIIFFKLYLFKKKINKYKKKIKNIDPKKKIKKLKIIILKKSF